MTDKDGKPPGGWFSAMVWVVLVAGLLLSLGAYFLTQGLQDRTIQAEQKRATVLASQSLLEYVDISMEILRGVRGLFLASDHVSPTEFGVFSNIYLAAHPEIQALEWIPRVRDAQRHDYEQAARDAGHRDFAIREKTPRGGMAIAGTREEYFPVYYVEPLAGNEPAVGFDLASNARRLSSLQQARDLGQAQATASITLAQETARQKGFLIFVPIYRGDIQTLDQRRRNLGGFGLGVFRISDLFNLSVQRLGTELAGLGLKLHDISNSDQPDLLHDGDDPSLPSLLDSPEWKATSSLAVAGRHWRVSSQASRGYVESRRSALPLLVATIGLLLTLLMVIYLLSLLRRDREVRELVGLRTHELHLSDQKSRVIIENAADAVVTIDKRGHITLFNPTAERMFGYSAAEVMNKNVKVLMPEPYHSEHDGYLEHYQSTGKAQIIGQGRQVTGQRKDGSTFPLNLSVGEAFVNDEPIYVGVMLDLTHRLDAERALLRAKEAAEDANRQKSSFLNVMSHELRTPLTVILGYLPLLEKEEQMPEPAMVAQIAQDMNLSGNHLLGLINDLLDISKIEAGQMSLHREKVDAAVLTKQVLDKFRHEAAEKQLELAYISDDFQFSVDPRRFKQILINLVGNAIKFTEQGRIEISARRNGDKAEFQIQDDGVGIPSGDLEHIFEHFRQVDSSSTRQAGGSGLGLAITKHLVELHGGTIKAASEEGRGSRFCFTIKLEEEN